MGDVTGSVRAVSIEGIDFRIAADANVAHIVTNWENSRIPTSGKSMRKMVKRVPLMEGVTLITNPQEADSLKSFAESLDDVKFSVTMADGSIYKADGSVEFENRESEEGRTQFQLQPALDWTLY